MKTNRHIDDLDSDRASIVSGGVFFNFFFYVRSVVLPEEIEYEKSFIKCWSCAVIECGQYSGT